MSGVEVIVPVAFFVMVVIIVKIVADNRMRQRLIDKGLVDEKAKYLFSDKLMADGPTSLKWGLVLLAIGGAVVIGQSLHFRRDEITFALVFGMSGLALIIYYFFARHMKNGNGKKE